MNYLAFGLAQEGVTDFAALRVLLNRVLAQMAHADHTTSFSWDIVDAGKSSDENIQQVVASADFDVVIAHRDGAARASGVASQLRTLGAVPLVPVKEMEAWLVVDPPSIGRALGVPNHAMQPLASPRMVESFADPKQTYRDHIQQCVGLRRVRRAGQRTNDYIELIAGELDLNLLGQLSAFRDFRSDLRDAIGQKGWPFRQT